MSTDYHTPIPSSPPQAANAATINGPLGQLDVAIGDAMTFAVNNNAELVAARDTYINLDARLDALTYASSGVAIWTLTNGAAAAAQKVVTVDSTIGFIAGAYVVYTLVGGAVEYNAIDTIDSPTQLTLDTNIGTGGIANDTVIAMTAVFTQTTPGGILIPQITTGTGTGIRLTSADPDETDFGWSIRTSGPFEGTYDTGMNLGYNVGMNSARVDTSKTAIYLTIEGTYQYSPTLSRTELYLEALQTAAAGGGIIRPYNVNVEHQSDSIVVQYIGSEHVFTGYGATANSQMNFYPLGTSGTLRLINVAIESTTNDIVLLSQMNAAGSGMIQIAKVNAANQIQFGSSSNTIYIPGSQITDGTISSGNGGLSTLGNVLLFFNAANFPTTYRHEISASLSYGGASTESLLAFDLTDATTTTGHKRPLLLRGDNRAILGAPTTTIEDAGLAAGNISFWLDESGNTLTVKAKYSGGTVKSGTVALA